MVAVMRKNAPQLIALVAVICAEAADAA